jgi:hypothetical protein
VLVPTVEKGIQRMEAKNKDNGKRPIWQPLWDIENIVVHVFRLVGKEQGTFWCC